MAGKKKKPLASRKIQLQKVLMSSLARRTAYQSGRNDVHASPFPGYLLPFRNNFRGIFKKCL
jgi:hypothetical protein